MRGAVDSTRCARFNGGVELTDEVLEGCITRRMPRMQVYLPDELYNAVKERGMPASELLQEAVEAELRRQRLNEAAREHVAEVIAEVGEPSARERARASAIARRIRDRAAARAS